MHVFVCLSVCMCRSVGSSVCMCIYVCVWRCWRMLECCIFLWQTTHAAPEAHDCHQLSVSCYYREGDGSVHPADITQGFVLCWELHGDSSVKSPWVYVRFLIKASYYSCAGIGFLLCLKRSIKKTIIKRILANQWVTWKAEREMVQSYKSRSKVTKTHTSVIENCTGL